MASEGMDAPVLIYAELQYCDVVLTPHLPGGLTWKILFNGRGDLEK